MIHLTIQQISSYFDGELTESSEVITRQHLASCKECSTKLAKLGAQVEALAKALMSDPDEACFERLTREIEERIRPEQPKASVPRAVPAVDTASPAVAGRRYTGRRSRRSVPWVAAALITIVAVSAGVMLSGVGRVLVRPGAREDGDTGRPSSGPAAVTPELASPETESSASAEAPATELHAEEEPAGESADTEEPELVPVPIRGDEALAAPPEEQSSPTSDPFADLQADARTAVRSAQQRSDAAANDLSAVGFEAAATDWEQALPLLRGDAYRAGRRRLAEARYHAWQLAPSGERAAKAEAAIRAHLVLAPAGPERDRTIGWLSRLEEAGAR